MRSASASTRNLVIADTSEWPPSARETVVIDR